jgi:hypothetical protein
VIKYGNLRREMCFVMLSVRLVFEPATSDVLYLSSEQLFVF